MALDPNFPTTPKYATNFVVASNTAIDGSGVITPVVTAGANGSLVTDLRAIPAGTVAATAVRLFISLNGGTSWTPYAHGALAAWAVSQTAAPTVLTFVDKNNPDGALRLPANAKLGFTVGVTSASAVFLNAEYMDY